MFIKSIDYEKCTACMACEKICTNSRVIIQNDKGLPEFRFDYKCISCGHCFAICTQNAITFEAAGRENEPEQSFTAGPLPLADDAKIPDAESLHAFLCATRTNRFFLNKPVEKEKITKILDAMVRAPSAGNEQNRNFYILCDQAKIASLEEQIKAYYQQSLMIYKNPLVSSLLSFFSAIKARKVKQVGQPGQQIPFRESYRFYKQLFRSEIAKDNSFISYLRDSQAAIIITSSRKAGTIHQSFYKGDAAIAATYGTLMAKAVGLASCWMGLLEMAVNKDKGIRESLTLGEHERVDAALALGYSDLDWKQIPPRGPVKVIWE